MYIEELYFLWFSSFMVQSLVFCVYTETNVCFSLKQIKTVFLTSRFSNKL